MMKHGSHALVLILIAGLAFTAVPARAGDKLEIVEDVIVRFLRAHKAEVQEKGKVGDQVAEIDRKIAEWRDCAAKFNAAGEASGSKLGGFAAKLAMKAKCGASSDEGFLKDRAKLLEGPNKAALSAGDFKSGQYTTLADRILAFLNGDAGDLSASEKTVLEAHKADLMGALGDLVRPAGGGNAGGGGMTAGGHLPSTWAGDAAWGYIGYMFSITYLSGATMFEKPYQPGEWTKWQLTDSETPDEKTLIERAFLGKTPEGSEWWRTKSIITHGAVTDTVTLEGLFKPLDAEGMMRQLVRMRGKLPGDTEPREMMVPQYLSMLSSAAVMPMKPTPESVEGATVGTETVAGVSAKHVKFSGGSGGSTIEWWLADSIPGGWVKFLGTNPRSGEDKGKSAGWTLELTGSGNGAASELGVMK